MIERLSDWLGRKTKQSMFTGRWANIAHQCFINDIVNYQQLDQT